MGIRTAMHPWQSACGLTICIYTGSNFEEHFVGGQVERTKDRTLLSKVTSNSPMFMCKWNGPGWRRWLPWRRCRTVLSRLHGWCRNTGEAGKTEVINLVLAYAQGFCKEIEYVFDQGMINNKRNLKTPVKTRTLHLSEPYNSRSTTNAYSDAAKEG